MGTRVLVLLYEQLTRGIQHASETYKRRLSNAYPRASSWPKQKYSFHHTNNNSLEELTTSLTI